MDPLAILCILIGTLMLATRAPLIFAPNATLRFFRSLTSSDARIRGIGLLIAPLALTLIVLARDYGPAARLLQALGWIFAAAALWLLASPGSYRRVAHGVIDVVESSVDVAFIRILGLVAVSIGVALIYVGIYVL